MVPLPKSRRDWFCSSPQGLGLPVEHERENLWYWNAYDIAADFTATCKSGEVMRLNAKVGAFVVLVFDKPVAVSGFRIVSTIARPLPPHEVKSHSVRHAVIFFAGDMSGQIIEIQVRS
jgi:hypothetical protein